MTSSKSAIPTDDRRATNSPAGLMISVSGLRGIVGESLTSEMVGIYAHFCGATLAACAAEANLKSDRPFIIARDSRTSGAALARAAAAALGADGFSLVDAGIAATPTVGVLVGRLRALGALQITASHNPAQWNGVKVFTHQGRVLGAAGAQKLNDRFSKALQSAATADAPSSEPNPLPPAMLDDPHQPHLQRVLRCVDVPKIAQRRMRVLLDTNGGAGGVLGARLLSELGCQAESIGGNPDGRFLHGPEPLKENLGVLCRSVAEGAFDVGFALDPDADRLALVDETGTYLGEEYTLALVVDHVLRGRPGAVIANVSTTKAVEDIAIRYGCRFVRSKVGEANVVEAMLSETAVIGGEGNGGVIDPRIGLVRDAFAGMALILEGLVQSGRSLHQWWAQLPQYQMAKHKFNLQGPLEPALAAICERFDGASIDRTDGVRFAWPDRWLHVRPSNTEPVLRVLAEAATIEQAEELARQTRQVLEPAMLSS